jgi:hypothetical protein
MEDHQEMSGNDGGEAPNSEGQSDESISESHGENQEGHEGNTNTSDPLYVQKRLKQQKRAHDREMREVQARMAELHSQLSSQNPQRFEANPYAETVSPQGTDETISKAVSFALAQRDQEERKAKAAEQAANISNHYQNLQRHLDTVADKYDDFDDVVRGDHVPFTASMRDAALMLPKKGPGAAGEVLYKLGKNPEELSRISKLFPHEQAAELVALSHAMIAGNDGKGQSSRPLGQVKSNPVTNSAGVTEKSSPAQIRALMKQGKFK